VLAFTKTDARIPEHDVVRNRELGSAIAGQRAGRRGERIDSIEALFLRLEQKCSSDATTRGYRMPGHVMAGVHMHHACSPLATMLAVASRGSRVRASGSGSRRMSSSSSRAAENLRRGTADHYATLGIGKSATQAEVCRPRSVCWPSTWHVWQSVEIALITSWFSRSTFMCSDGPAMDAPPTHSTTDTSTSAPCTCARSPLLWPWTSSSVQ
jgi:hypothetical protein